MKYFYHFLIYIFVLLFSSYFVDAMSQSIEYKYDKAGNRIAYRLINFEIDPDKEEGYDPEPLEDKVGERIFTLYPNPTYGILYVEIEKGEFEDSYIFHLSDLRGNYLMRYNHSGNGVIPIDLTSYERGVYFLNIESPEGTIRYKILKK
ncbi:T9SS type A sorting domain-containing protein [Marinilabiliaceae bacterium ANBcel2]|nr:T9SS type A sorting domain-containing protein [Marinilabiliaceae bacterium ANBcel2]